MHRNERENLHWTVTTVNGEHCSDIRARANKYCSRVDWSDRQVFEHEQKSFILRHHSRMSMRKEIDNERASQTDWFEVDEMEYGRRNQSINQRGENIEKNAREREKKETFFHIDWLCVSFSLSQDDLDILLEQLQTLEQRLDQSRMFRDVSTSRQPKAMSPTITAQFDELDQALATLNSTLNNVEIELGDSGNSSSSSGMSDSTTIIHQHHRQEDHDNHQHEVEVDEQFSDSGLSQSTDSISLPFKQSTQLRTYSQLSNTSSVSEWTLVCSDTMLCRRLGSHMWYFEEGSAREADSLSTGKDARSEHTKTVCQSAQWWSIDQEHSHRWNDVRLGRHCSPAP